MKIALMGPFSPYRGGIKHFNTLLHRHFVEDHTVLPINYRHLYPNFLFPGTSQFDAGVSTEESVGDRLFSPLSPFSWLQVYRKLKNWSPDLVIFKYWMPFFAPGIGSVMRLVKRTGAKSICIIDNLTPHEHRLGDHMLNKYMVNATDGFIAMSNIVEEQLLELKPHASYRLSPHPVYNNFGPRIAQADARRTLGLGANEPVILYFGFIRKYKGLLTLLDALPQVIERIGVKTIVAGEYYDPPDEYQARINEHNLAPHLINATKYIPDDEVALYFSAADLVVLPYITATQSGIVSIALEYELPCIVTNVGGLPLVVRHEKTGLIVPPDNKTALAEAIIAYFTTINREEMTENVRREKEHYSWGGMLKNIMGLAEELGVSEDR